ncbi:heparan-alpha-glucosaminide N-acetyltransferase [Artemisia annua]|uniref:Heparan-alpha-glucosaminide N-acetyltransferase n=1 Tax=Artemisia annua TaxID=35608 RepID=A0A2U1KLD3_ARTAN|nr:heparan-alpha-glucosaminide N-acetyltransferase [Artemisia annua]
MSSTLTDERVPFLHDTTDEITPFVSPSPDVEDIKHSSATAVPKQRLVSLDVFRGLTVALMILVDDAGGAFPSINHSPWFGVTLADFVMPFFLFSVGISVSLVFKRVSSKPVATKKVLLRSLKLFLLGLILQAIYISKAQAHCLYVPLGGYFHGRDDLTYGVDVNQIRWMGVLQRISIGYLMASITEIWCVNNNEVNSALTFGKKYYIQWMVVFVLGILYMSLLYGLYVPDWGFEVVSDNNSLSVPTYGNETQIVQCGVRGSLEPPCNAVGLIDRLLLGENHLYQRPVYKRTERISIGYLMASITEIWCVNNNEVNSALTFGKKYYIQWMVVFVLGILYMSLLYGLYVPDWGFEVVSDNNSLSVPTYGNETQIVQCGVRGSLEPPCNAVGLIDRLLLGENHLYQRPVYKRTEECSINSPDYGPLPPNAPAWCLAPFDPEGLLSSLMAAVTCFLGLQYGHVMVHYKVRCCLSLPVHFYPKVELPWYSLFFLLVGSYAEDFYMGKGAYFQLTIFCSAQFLAGVPLSKPLYTLSYMCITAGASGIVLIAIYYTVDVIHIQKPTILFQWMGMNALIVYALAACDIFPAALQGFYWRSPENNLVNATESLLEAALHSEKWGYAQSKFMRIGRPRYWGKFDELNDYTYFATLLDPTMKQQLVSHGFKKMLEYNMSSESPLSDDALNAMVREILKEVVNRMGVLLQTYKTRFDTVVSKSSSKKTKNQQSCKSYVGEIDFLDVFLNLEDSGSIEMDTELTRYLGNPNNHCCIGVGFQYGRPCS